MLHEAFVGAARADGADGVRSVRQDLDWIEPVAFTVDAAAEAAALEAELRERGASIGPMDAVTAGAVRDVGGTLITADDRFERVPGLAVETYR